MSEVKESVANYGPLKPLTMGQLEFPYWGIPIVLIIIFIILKLFIYIKDDKRHGK